MKGILSKAILQRPAQRTHIYSIKPSWTLSLQEETHPVHIYTKAGILVIKHSQQF